jgi:hypothetical protein
MTGFTEIDLEGGRLVMAWPTRLRKSALVKGDFADAQGTRAAY